MKPELLQGGDVGLVQGEDNSIDIAIQDNDLLVDPGLKTAVILSVFTDARASEDELPPEENSRRGWWGNEFPTVLGDEIGSKIWLLKREKRSLETLNRAEEYVQEALKWMVEDGVAISVDATATWEPNGMALEVLLQQPKETKKFRFKMKWSAEAGEN